MRFDNKSKEFINSIETLFETEFLSRIVDINALTTRIHPIVQKQPGVQLCIKGVRINTDINLKSDKWNPHIDDMSGLHLIINEHDCYKIYSNTTSMQIEHRFFKSWENDTRTILFKNYPSNTTIECNLNLVAPLLSALDKLNAMY